MALTEAKQRLAVTGGSMVATVVALFGLQFAYGMYSAANHQPIPRDTSSAFVELRDTQRRELMDAPMPIDRAMEAIAAADPSRSRIRSLQPVASSDPAPAAGWMHSMDYAAAPPALPEPEPDPEPETEIEPAPADAVPGNDETEASP